MDSPSSPLIYVARDIERTLGKIPSKDYLVISNSTPFAEIIKKSHPDHVTLITAEEGHSLGTYALLERPEVQTMLPAGSRIIVFQNTERIERLAAEHGWHILNPAAALSERVENKITQISWLGELGTKHLPPHRIAVTKDLTWEGEPFVLQWAHGHTGGSTVFISTAAQLKALQEKFPERLTRSTQFVRGSSFTVNAVVAGDKTLVGNISYQITGMTPFTDNAFTTVGNDWSLTHSLLDEAEIKHIESLTHEIGAKLSASGWKGLFGVDLIRDDERNSIHLIEINARQPASTSFESFLQSENRLQGIPGITIFEAHLKALQGEKIDLPLIPINDGAQVVQRVTPSIQSVAEEALGSLGLAGYIVITYQNTQPNSDLVRIQSSRGIMETHSKFNERGKEIVEIISGK